MSGDLINVKPDDVRKLARALERFGQQMTQANKEAMSAISAAYWHDSQKEKFEARYRDFHKRINGFVSGEISEMTGSLNRLASELDRVRSHNF